MGAETNEPVTDPSDVAATLRKAGLPETLEVAEMRLEYGLRNGSNGEYVWPSLGLENAKKFRESGDVIVVREVISLAWREVRDA